MNTARFARLAWGALAYNLGVIAWGAYVRASGSGAGCGRHWPLCDGQVVVRPKSVEMAIEFSHRATSGLSLVLAIVVVVAAFRTYPRGHLVRRGAVASLGFMLAEALVGAGLVLFELVAHDASMKRALSMSLHLTNTFLLLAAMTLTAWWASGGTRANSMGAFLASELVGSRARVRGQRGLAWILGGALATMFVLGTSGAVAALGDTLFPARSLSEGFAQDLSAGAHLFVRLRMLHPFIATASAAIVIGAATAARLLRPASPNVRVVSRVVIAAFVLQYGAGLLNVALLAPIWMQLVHLFLADTVWISLVVLTASALAETADARAPVLVPPDARAA